MLKQWVRSQEGPFDDASVASGLACPASEDKTRQEDARDADVNLLMERFMRTGELPLKTVHYGEFDFDLDLQEAIARVQLAEAQFADLPADLRSRYASWQDFVSALERGEVRFEAKPADSPAAGAGESAGSASVSAPVS